MVLTGLTCKAAWNIGDVDSYKPSWLEVEREKEKGEGEGGEEEEGEKRRRRRRGERSWD